MGIHQVETWKVKAYSLARDTGTVEQDYLESALALFKNGIGKIPADVSIYGIGKTGDQEPVYHTPSGLSGCVWEGEIIDFERRKWMEHVLKRFENPEFEEYLNSVASGEV